MTQSADERRATVSKRRLTVEGRVNQGHGLASAPPSRKRKKGRGAVTKRIY
jgi:hypothetical protein